MKTAILIPVYNEEEEIKNVLSQAVSQGVDNIIAVLDGPTDNSPEIIKRFSEGREKLIILEHEHNKGLTEAMKTGLLYALQNNFDLVIKIDGDGQMNLSQVGNFLDIFKEKKTDLIIATYDKDTPWMIKKDIWIYSALFYLSTGKWVSDLLSEFRSYSSKAMKDFIKSDIASMGSNISIIDLWREHCTISEIKGGVNYYIKKIRPAHIRILIDIRMQFIKSIWSISGMRSKMGSTLSVFVLTLLLLFNLTAGLKYNSPFFKDKER